MNTDITLKNPFTEGKIISKDTDPKVYHANGRRGEPDFVMSRSDLMEFHRCPARWIKGYKRKATEDMDWGNLLDATTLQPELFSRLYAVTPETYPAEPKKKGDPVENKDWNWNSNYCKAWRQNMETQGRKAVHCDDYQAVLSARETLLKNPIVTELLNQSDRQVMVMARYQDPATAIWISLKILIDILPHSNNVNWHSCLADLKSSGSANPSKWEYHCDDFDLDAQAALYLDVYNAATGEERTSFIHPCQENYPPYHVEMQLLDADYIYLGRMKYQSALRKYAQCLATNIWPGYECEKLAGCNVIRPPTRALKNL